MVTQRTGPGYTEDCPEVAAFQAERAKTLDEISRAVYKDREENPTLPRDVKSVAERIGTTAYLISEAFAPWNDNT